MEKQINSYIYFLQENNKEYVKIGYTKYIKQRMNFYRTNGKHNKVLAVIKGDRKTEKRLHERFSHLRVHSKGRETFLFKEELKKFIENLSNGLENITKEMNLFLKRELPHKKTSLKSAKQLGVQIDLIKMLIDKEINHRGSDLHFSLGDITKQTGISRNVLRKYQNGSVKTIKLQDLTTLCNFFDCTPSDLLAISPTLEKS